METTLYHIATSWDIATKGFQQGKLANTILLGLAPIGTRIVALDATFGSFTLLNWFHIKWTSFFGENV